MHSAQVHLQVIVDCVGKEVGEGRMFGPFQPRHDTRTAEKSHGGHP